MTVQLTAGYLHASSRPLLTCKYQQAQATHHQCDHIQDAGERRHLAPSQLQVRDERPRHECWLHDRSISRLIIDKHLMSMHQCIELLRCNERGAAEIATALQTSLYHRSAVEPHRRATRCHSGQFQDCQNARGLKQFLLSLFQGVSPTQRRARSGSSMPATRAHRTKTCLLA